MKKITKVVFASLLIISSCSKSEDKTPSIPPVTCLPTNLQNGVVAIYTFGNGSLADSSGNNYNLTNPSSASSGIDRAGNPNCAFNFNQSNGDFLEYQNPAFLDNLPSSGLSISFWYKSNENANGVFISRDDQYFCASGQWSVEFINNVIVFNDKGGTIDSYGVGNSSWQHIVVTSDNNNFQLFKNSVLVSSSNDFTYCQGTNPIINQGNLFIGKSYDGLIDDVVIYNRVVTLTEVIGLYNLPACCN